MKRVLRLLLADTSATAAAEMALVTPLLLLIMYAPVELGNYFLSTHVVSKAVRDGSRYAARRSFGEFTCAAASADVIDKTRNIVRTGQVTSGGNARLRGWTAPATITVAVSCDSSGTYTGAYRTLSTAFPALTGVPIVTVTATVPYQSFFARLGFGAANTAMSMSSQAVVVGS